MSIIEYLQREENLFVPENFNELVFSETEVKKLSKKQKQLNLFDQSTRIRVLRNLKQCDNATLNQLLYYCEENTVVKQIPRQLSIFTAGVGLITFGIGALSNFYPEEREKGSIEFIIFIALIVLWFMIGNVLKKEHYSYLVMLIKEAKLENDESNTL